MRATFVLALAVVAVGLIDCKHHERRTRNHYNGSRTDSTKAPVSKSEQGQGGNGGNPALSANVNQDGKLTQGDGLTLNGPSNIRGGGGVDEQQLQKVLKQILNILESIEGNGGAQPSRRTRKRLEILIRTLYRFLGFGRGRSSRRKLARVTVTLILRRRGARRYFIRITLRYLRSKGNDRAALRRALRIFIRNLVIFLRSILRVSGNGGGNDLDLNRILNGLDGLGGGNGGNPNGPDTGSNLKGPDTGSDLNLPGLGGGNGGITDGLGGLGKVLREALQRLISALKDALRAIVRVLGNGGVSGNDGVLGNGGVSGNDGGNILGALKRALENLIKELENIFGNIRGGGPNNDALRQLIQKILEILRGILKGLNGRTSGNINGGTSGNINGGTSGNINGGNLNVPGIGGGNGGDLATALRNLIQLILSVLQRIFRGGLGAGLGGGGGAGGGNGASPSCGGGIIQQVFNFLFGCDGNGGLLGGLFGGNGKTGGFLSGLLSFGGNGGLSGNLGGEGNGGLSSLLATILGGVGGGGIGLDGGIV